MYDGKAEPITTMVRRVKLRIMSREVCEPNDVDFLSVPVGNDGAQLVCTDDILRR